MSDASLITGLLRQLVLCVTLQVLVEQRASLGSAFARPGVYNSIAEARKEIARSAWLPGLAKGVAGGTFFAIQLLIFPQTHAMFVWRTA